jgi:hypothetical protein
VFEAARPVVLVAGLLCAAPGNGPELPDDGPLDPEEPTTTTSTTTTTTTATATTTQTHTRFDEGFASAAGTEARAAAGDAAGGGGGRPSVELRPGSVSDAGGRAAGLSSSPADGPVGEESTGPGRT